MGNDLQVIAPRAFPLKPLTAATYGFCFIAFDFTFAARQTAFGNVSINSILESLTTSDGAPVLVRGTGALMPIPGAILTVREEQLHSFEVAVDVHVEVWMLFVSRERSRLKGCFEV